MRISLSKYITRKTLSSCSSITVRKLESLQIHCSCSTVGQWIFTSGLQLFPGLLCYIWWYCKFNIAIYKSVIPVKTGINFISRHYGFPLSREWKLISTLWAKPKWLILIGLFLSFSLEIYAQNRSCSTFFPCKSM